MYNCLNKNGYIESTIQKGFTPGMAGTFEHTYHMAYLINQARAKQRSIVITLLDLKNAFGEVHHDLITDVLLHHNIPPELQKLLNICILTFLHVYQHQSTLRSLFISEEVFYRAIALVHCYSIQLLTPSSSILNKKNMRNLVINSTNIFHQDIGINLQMTLA